MAGEGPHYQFGDASVGQVMLFGVEWDGGADAARTIEWKNGSTIAGYFADDPESPPPHWVELKSPTPTDSASYTFLVPPMAPGTTRDYTKSLWP